MFKLAFADLDRHLFSRPITPFTFWRLHTLMSLLLMCLLMLVLLFSVAPANAASCNTIFLTDKNGNQVFPFCKPNQATGAAGGIDNMAFGQTTPAAVRATPLAIDSGTKTATATTGAATLNKNAGVITSEALTTAAGATYTLTLTDSAIAAADQVMASVQLGTATTGSPTITTVTPAAGSVVIVVQNIHATAALNGTIKISFVRFAN